MTRKMRVKLWRIIISATCFATLFVFSILCVLSETPSLLLHICLYSLIGYDIVIKAVGGLFRGQMLDENFLMFVASVGAFFIGEYVEAVAVTLFYQVGEFFQMLAVEKSRKSITSLLDIRPDEALVIRNGREERTLCEEIEVGERIIVGVGERVPLDGIIIEGSSVVNASALTGESLPVEVQAGDEILSGVINESGTLTVRVTKPQSQSTVSRILDLVENATMKKAKTENFITRFAIYYTPVVVAFALLLAVIPPLVIDATSVVVWSDWVYRALAFLVVSCPCALVISVPLSFFGAMGGSAKAGILFKGGVAIEELDKVSTLFTDKTGTLTKAQFGITAVYPEEKSEEILYCCQIAESRSTHPLAKAFNGDSEGYEISEEAGGGVIAKKGDDEIVCGNARFLRKNEITVEEVNENGSVIYCARRGKLLGYLVMNDIIKEDSAEAVLSLKKMGVETIMLTGDNPRIAKSVADDLGIERYYAMLTPEEKMKVCLEGKSKGKIAFVGDGINDAPALATADLGVAMGGVGSDVAIEVADLVLMKDSLLSLAQAKKIAKKTMRIAKQNIVFALAVKFGVLILTALGITNMWLAVFADVGVALLAIANAMRTLSTNKIK